MSRSRGPHEKQSRGGGVWLSGNDVDECGGEAMKCEGVTAKGKRCRARAVGGSRTCLLHTPGEAARLGARGGRARSFRLPVEGELITPPTTALSLRDFVAEALAKVRGGTMDVRIGNCVGQLASVLSRVIESATFESRLAALEAAEKMRASCHDR